MCHHSKQQHFDSNIKIQSNISSNGISLSCSIFTEKKLLQVLKMILTINKNKISKKGYFMTFSMKKEGERNKTESSLD